MQRFKYLKVRYGRERDITKTETAQHGPTRKYCSKQGTSKSQYFIAHTLKTIIITICDTLKAFITIWVSKTLNTYSCQKWYNYIKKKGTLLCYSLPSSNHKTPFSSGNSHSVCEKSMMVMHVPASGKTVGLMKLPEHKTGCQALKPQKYFLKLQTQWDSLSQKLGLYCRPGKWQAYD